LDIVYLDMQKKVYCNMLMPGGQRCDIFEQATALNGPSFNWSSPPGTEANGFRDDLSAIDDDVFDSEFRRIDLFLIRVPDLNDRIDVTDEILNMETETVAILNYRPRSTHKAGMSLATTFAVLTIILAGIYILTKDLAKLSKTLLKPLRELSDDMEAIPQLQLAGVQESDGADWGAGQDYTAEVKMIRRTFENMKKAIKSWGKYVPWPVVQLLIRSQVEAKIQVEDLHVSIFFSDIASFTTIVENLAPERSMHLLSRYFNDMSKVIDEHGGVVLEFIGDAILAIFGAPLANDDHPIEAVKCAVKMQHSLRKMNDWSAKQELPEVKIRAGLHTCQALVGNMGFHSRMKYGVVGEECHIPDRLEEMNKNYGTSLMISDSTRQCLPDNVFILRPIDYVYLHHTEHPVSEPVYEVMCREKVSKNFDEHPLARPARLHEQGMELYRAQKFSRAWAKFQEVNTLLSEYDEREDELSSLMMKRCSSYLEQLPPEGWEGVWDRGTL